MVLLLRKTSRRDNLLIRMFGDKMGLSMEIEDWCQECTKKFKRPRMPYENLQQKERVCPDCMRSKLTKSL